MFEGLSWRLWVKKRRKELGLTQEQLAEQVAYSVEMIGRVERGLHRPSLELTTLLAAILGVPAAKRKEFIAAARASTTAVGNAETALRKHSLRIPGLPATALIGRMDDVARVYESLARPHQRLVTISGPAGVGKTRLAMYVAQDLEQHYPDGVFWIALAALREPLLVFNALAEALGVTETSGQSLLDALRATLLARQVLLVLDNCEQLREMSLVVAELLAAPGVQILATSRKRLRVRGEQQISLAPLSLPPEDNAITAAAIGSYPAIRLFLERIISIEPEFQLTDRNATTLARICRALDGLPLALELAAARVRVLPPEAMLARIDDRLTWLLDGWQDLPPHQQTLVGTIAWSYDLLSSAQQQLLRRLSVFSGGFTLTAAAAVCSPLDDAAADLLSAIAELDEWHLLGHCDESSSDPRYAMLQTIHEFGAGRLKESGEEMLVRRRHLNYCLDLVDPDGELSSPSPVAAWLGRCECERENFRAALQRSLLKGGDAKSGLRLGVALGRYWELRGHWHEGRHWIGQLLARDNRDEPRRLARGLYYAGRFAYLQGDYGPAEWALEQSLQLGREHDDRSTQAWALNTLGWIALGRFDHGRAEFFLQQSLMLCLAMGDTVIGATVLNALGSIKLELGELDTAEALLNESLMLRREHGDQQGIARSLNVLGLVAQHRGATTAAYRLIAESSALFRAAGDPLGLALSLNNLGLLLLGTAQTSEARRHLAEALTIARELGSALCTTMSLCYLGWVELQQGIAVTAARLFAESLSLAQAHQLNFMAVLSHLGLAQVALLAGDLAVAGLHFAASQRAKAQTSMALVPFHERVAAEIEQSLSRYPGLSIADSGGS